MAYTAGDILITATMQASTGLPADAFVNTFAFQTIDQAAPSDAELNTLFGVVDQFYDWIPGGGQSVSNYISNAVSRAATHELAAYTIVAGDLGSPRLAIPWLGPDAPAAGRNLAAETAGVLSFHADLSGAVEVVGNTRPRASRRGRIYVGPLTINAITDVPEPLLSTGFLTALRASAVHMADAAETAGFYWSVWSRKLAVLHPVVGGWTDNAIDTQRRRGVKATTRTTFGPVGP